MIIYKAKTSPTEQGILKMDTISINKKNKSSVLVFSLVSLFIFTANTGCESKVAEVAATGVIDKTTTDYKIKAQNEFDEKISLLQSKVSRIRETVLAIQKNMNIKSLVPLSVFDLISEANLKIQDELVTVKSKTLSIKGSFYLKSELLAEECKEIGYHLSSDSIYPLTEINYALSSCQTDGAYLPAIKVTFSENKVQFQIVDSNLKKLLPFNSIKEKIPGCEFGSNPDRTTSCSNIQIGETKENYWFGDIFSDGITKITITAFAKDTYQLTYVGEIVISADGSISKFQIIPVKPMDTQNSSDEENPDDET